MPTICGGLRHRKKERELVTLEDLSKGVTFLHGYFQQRFVIDKFQIFENGLLAEARVDTDVCDEFLDDVFKWVAERAGITIELSTTPLQKLYLSQIEVQSNISLNISFAKIAPLGKQISDIQRGYGQIISDLEISGLSFGTAGDAPSFKFERREGPSVPPDLYFASSGLRTKDHMRMLEALETLL